MIRGTKVEIEKPTPVNIKMNISVHNRFDIEVIDAKTGEIKQRAVAYNVICNRFWTVFLSQQVWGSYIQYGTGSGTPSASDSTLFSYSGAISCSIDEWRYYETPWFRRKGVMSETQAVGVEITEVGLGENSADTMYTHAMLQDANGNPISIIKTNTDIINFYCTIYFVHDRNGYDGVYFCNAGGTLSRTLSLSYFFGESTSFSIGFLRHAMMAIYPTRMSLSTSSCLPKGTSYTSSTGGKSRQSISFNSSTKTLSVSYSRFGISDGNRTGGSPGLYLLSGNTTGSPISGYTYNNYPVFYISAREIGPWRITNESVGVGDGHTTDFTLDFASASNATIYVNGVAQSPSEVTVKKEPPTTSVANDLTDWVETVGGNSLYPYEPIIRYHVFEAVPSSKYHGYSTGFQYIYNPYYELGIDSFTFYTGSSLSNWSTIECSDDLQTWNSISLPTAATLNIPDQYKHCKYFRFKRVFDSSDACTAYITKITCNAHNGYPVHFNTPPAVGDVITASYDTDFLPKDENHVFDLSLTMQFGEYTD